MRFSELIKSKTFLFGILILTAYIVISAIIYNSVVLKMENDMNADNNIQLETIKLSNSIRLTIDSAQDVVYFSRENDKKRVKTSLLKLSALIGVTNKRFEEFNKNLEKFPFLKKTGLPFENKAYYDWKNLITPILVTIIIHHKIMAKRAFMEPLFISMYKAGPNYAPLIESAFEHRIKDALYFHLILNLIFIAGFFLFFIILILFIFNISSKELKIKQSEKKYRTLVEFLPIGVYQATTDGKGRFINVNDYMVTIFEASGKEELMNTKIADLYAPGEIMRVDIIKNIIKKGTYEFEGKRKTLKGRIIDVYIACRFKKDDYGKDIIDCVLLDITKEKELEKKLKENEELFSTIFNGMTEGVYINDTRILYANPAAVEFFGYPEKELYNMNIWDLFGEKDRPVIKANIERRLNGERFYFEYTFYTFTKKGKEKYILFHVQTIVYQGRFVALAIFFDITDKVLLERELEKEKLRFQELSETDPLTGIFNRRKLDNILDEYVKLALRYNMPLSLIMFDIDHFKEINDNYGHQIGDNILIELANLIKTNLRETDFFARFGGEEFMILMPETNLIYAKAKAESLRKLIEENVFKYIYRLTCSFGVVEYGGKDNFGNTQDIINSFIKRVDNALYRAKENGRNRVEEGF